MNVNTKVTTPWAGLGAKIEPKDSLETSLKKAELDWRVVRTPVLYNINSTLKVGKGEVLCRSDNDYELGIVSKNYKISEPFEVIQSFRDIISHKKWFIEYMGILDEGKRFWALIKTDRIYAGMNIYLLLTTTFDGSSGVTGKFITLSEDCTSLSLAVADNTSYAKFSLTHKANFDVKQVEQRLNLVDKAGKNFESYVETLRKIKVKDAEAVQFIFSKLEKKVKSIHDVSTRQSNLIKKVFDVFEQKDNNRFELVQALAQHVDYNVGRTVNNRIRAAWFGLGDKLKVTSFNELLQKAS